MQGRDINLDVGRVIGYRNFCNKLWNATRFAMASLGPAFVPSPGMAAEVLGSAAASGRDRWILARLRSAVLAADEQLRGYEFGAAVSTLYAFWLNELCDVYLVRPADGLHEN